MLFVKPEMEIVKFDVEDILTTSGAVVEEEETLPPIVCPTDWEIV